MPQIEFEISGDRVVGLRFEDFPELARAKLEQRMGPLTDRLLAAVRAGEPTRTGKLQGDTVSVVREGENYITGVVRISADFGKAAVLNYGGHRDVTVRSHVERLGHVFGREVPPIEVTVAEHERLENIAERLFVSGAADEMHDAIISELGDALGEATTESNAG